MRHTATLRAGGAPGRISVTSRIETAFRVHEPALRLDRDDQVFFLQLLYDLVVGYRPRNVLQTGTFTGASLLAVLFAFQDSGNHGAHVFTIDPEPDEYFRFRRPVDLARRVVAAEGLRHRAVFLRAFSGPPSPGFTGRARNTPAWSIPRLPRVFDLLVVDGDHSYRAALADLRLGAARLLPDGPRLVVVHDYNGIPDVRRAVDDFLSETPSSLVFTTATPSGAAVLRLSSSPPPISM